MNTNLSITIPSFNRAQFLDYSLSVHIPLAKEYDVAIYISDNNSTDNTFEIVKKWMKDYDYLFYTKNELNLGPDKNFELALNLPDTKYVWLIGDTSLITMDVFKGAIKNTDSSYDAIIINETTRVRNVESQIIDDKQFLLSNLGWHITQLACIIYSKKLIDNANFIRYTDTWFIHVGGVFEYLSYKENFSVKWISELSIDNIRIKNIPKISWQENTLDIWLKKWPNFVFSLPPVYLLKSKIKMIQTHNQMTNIFGIKSLLSLRAKGFYSLSHYLSYKYFFDIALGKYSIFKFLVIGVMPQFFVKFSIALYIKINLLFNPFYKKKN